MVWGLVSFFLLRIALPVFVGFGLGTLNERWQKNREKEVKRKPHSA